ncbi:XRE family transcriptional regulator [Wohlfahrtiimonas chitiniclastica]|uniref:XRE family transcriptional regulator n=1 Tax=Wohlfahrtiimonas chitiniclastica TaxID=400946 RepID=UPI000B99623B|nr:XRE family transcriptional regulator [Wohlfahrtiimonas chitiniclastica]MBS7815882.1 XRE family transcriptional regulator [Wohlfahrtiimonas chitiniclastica]MBS7822123.1 XRE family transcriptional regulator [Wohlfahrtiimonas chitiniclastica]MBS7829915.1 XRE family transcriptional regulator [Wohlfahrtiimonas chitiniclastica]MBS7831882.1 XRE family transcriptional regulator [Wohlfahrtiimonas chitiniclastica]OYQ79053.1 hypothetical protein B9T12_04575 [Wohlfahrtiimonas chitiniclastica]
MEFNPDRLVFARELRGYSQKQLADQLGISSRAVRYYEAGEHIPDDIKKISEILEIDERFLFGETLTKISSDKISFRALSKMSAKFESQVSRNLELAIKFNEWLESKFDLPQHNLPDLSMYQPEEAAIALRQEWGLADRPIGNMLALLEKHGIRVFSLKIKTLDMDACCTWHEETPYIFLNTGKSSERIRFDAAHELGHLVLDIHGYPKGDNHRENEMAMNRFASAFLMPRESVKQKTPNFVTVDTLIDLKKHWKVSVAALAYRLKDLKLVSEWVYGRIISPEISKKGYRSMEPMSVEMDKSLALSKISTLLKEDNISLNEIVKEIDGTGNVNDLLAFLFDIDFLLEKNKLKIINNNSSYIKNNHISSNPPNLEVIK